MRYLLSHLVPVPMRSRYATVGPDGTTRAERASWVQWRGRVFRHRMAPA